MCHGVASMSFAPVNDNIGWGVRGLVGGARASRGDVGSREKGAGSDEQFSVSRCNSSRRGPFRAWADTLATSMTPPRAEVVTFCAATFIMVAGAVGLLFSSGRGPLLIAVGGLNVVGILGLVWLLRARSRP
jgi:hypothetical protein